MFYNQFNNIILKLKDLFSHVLFIFLRSGNVWIGLHETDPLDGSNVQWVGCEDPIYRNFAAPGPSSTPDDSKCFTVDSTGQWKSERCDQKYGFVCEENMGKVS